MFPSLYRSGRGTNGTPILVQREPPNFQCSRTRPSRSTAVSVFVQPCPETGRYFCVRGTCGFDFIPWSPISTPGRLLHTLRTTYHSVLSSRFPPLLRSVSIFFAQSETPLSDLVPSRRKQLEGDSVSTGPSCRGQSPSSFSPSPPKYTVLGECVASHTFAERERVSPPSPFPPLPLSTGTNSPFPNFFTSISLDTPIKGEFLFSCSTPR